jgi:hypothetical protein
MTHPAQISRADNVALRKEIGERLGLSLDLKPVGMPPHLAMLVRQWRDQPSNRLLTSSPPHLIESLTPPITPKVAGLPGGAI